MDTVVDIAADCRKEQACLVETKYNVYKGWLIPYVIVGDYAFNNGRWVWWLNCLANGHIPKEPLKKIHFVSPGDPSTRQVAKHIVTAIENIGYRRGNWQALTILMDWILWGLGEGEFPDIDEETHMWLYRYFQIGQLQKFPNDYWGDIISEHMGNGWNPTAFFPTPLSVAAMISLLSVSETDPKAPFLTVIDPCVGTGRMLMCASNHALFLYGCDIDPVIIKAARINLHLYAPWGALTANYIDESPYYEIPDAVSTVARNRLIVASQMLKEIAVAVSGPGAPENVGKAML